MTRTLPLSLALLLAAAGARAQLLPSSEPTPTEVEMARKCNTVPYRACTDRDREVQKALKIPIDNGVCTAGDGNIGSLWGNLGEQTAPGNNLPVGWGGTSATHEEANVTGGQLKKTDAVSQADRDAAEKDRLELEKEGYRTIKTDDGYLEQIPNGSWVSCTASQCRPAKKDELALVAADDAKKKQENERKAAENKGFTPDGGFNGSSGGGTTVTSLGANKSGGGIVTPTATTPTSTPLGGGSDAPSDNTSDGNAVGGDLGGVLNSLSGGGGDLIASNSGSTGNGGVTGDVIKVDGNKAVAEALNAGYTFDNVNRAAERTNKVGDEVLRSFGGAAGDDDVQRRETTAGGLTVGRQ